MFHKGVLNSLLVTCLNFKKLLVNCLVAGGLDAHTRSTSNTNRVSEILTVDVVLLETHIHISYTI